MAINTNAHSTHTHTHHIDSIWINQSDDDDDDDETALHWFTRQPRKKFFLSSIIIQYTIWVKKKNIQTECKNGKNKFKNIRITHKNTHNTQWQQKQTFFPLSFSIMHTNRKMKFSFHQMYLVMTINVMFWVSFLPVCVCL